MTARRLASLPAVLIMAGWLTACDAPVVSPGYVNPGSWDFAKAVMAKGPMLVRVAGTPYPVSQQALAEVIEREMAKGIFWYANPRFSTDPAKAVGGPFYVSLIFAPATWAPVSAESRRRQAAHRNRREESASPPPSVTGTS
ncbi:MAG: hypothetical protein HC834_10280 [Rhodospirillales bacterium]|nr:hypothetical protein [Rhodospirillales bacterium]